MPAFIPDPANEVFRLAQQLVTRSNRNIFLTGKAGTGKTTFLKYIRENCVKQMAIVAPTGVAAINAGGVTLHSFFQLPLAPFIPVASAQGFSNNSEEVSDRHNLLSRLKLNSEKKKVIQELELLVIDEISMVRCDTLDAVDSILRHVRHRPAEKFGGVQLLFIGDLFQLPPVIRDNEWNLLSEFYPGPYFFDSLVLRDEQPLYIEFDRIYRQSDENFIRILNQVRNNELDTEGLAILESRYNPDFRHQKEDGYIILTTHNNRAAEINAKELALLDSRLFSYPASVKDEFPDRAYPAEETLQLKEGAQVMFIRNDTAENGKRFFNGKIGIVTRLEQDKVFVQCTAGEETISVEKETWENIRYTVNKSTRHLDAEVLGSFTQFPLRLAWAITIHKSQGLTFQKAIIDAGAAFAPGQVYVALSRCTSLGGMILKSQVRTSSLVNDKRILAFSQQATSSEKLQEELVSASRQYAQNILLSVFDFTTVQATAGDCMAYLAAHHSSFNSDAAGWGSKLFEKLELIASTGKKFQSLLLSLFPQSGELTDSPVLQERLRAAVQYFDKEITTVISFIQDSPVVTDSRLHAKEYNDSLREIFAQLANRQFLLKGLDLPFDIESFLRRKAGFKLPAFTVNSYAGAQEKQFDHPHPQLYQLLRKKRDALCAAKDLPIYMVAGSATLDEMARFLPGTHAELREITGFGEAKVSRYGDAFLDIILEYTDEHGLVSLMTERNHGKKKTERNKPVESKASKTRGETVLESLRLFREGLPIEDIAKTRKLAVSTVESHFEKLIVSGKLGIDELLEPARRSQIEQAIKELDGGSLTAVRQKLGDGFSYGEIRFVMAAK